VPEYQSIPFLSNPSGKRRKEVEKALKEENTADGKKQGLGKGFPSIWRAFADWDAKDISTIEVR
jgi:hypothetical protein